MASPVHFLAAKLLAFLFVAYLSLIPLQHKVSSSTSLKTADNLQQQQRSNIKQNWRDFAAQEIPDCFMVSGITLFLLKIEYAIANRLARLNSQQLAKTPNIVKLKTRRNYQCLSLIALMFSFHLQNWKWVHLLLIVVLRLMGICVVWYLTLVAP